MNYHSAKWKRKREHILKLDSYMDVIDNGMAESLKQQPYIISIRQYTILNTAMLTGI